MITSFELKSKKELLLAVLLPFLVSRLLLLSVAWFSQYFTPSSAYFPDAPQSFAFTSFRWLDVWGRWDSGWYLQIAAHGYPQTSGEGVDSSFAFFPLYPLTIKLLSLPLPQAWLNQTVYLFLGVFLSNLFALLGLGLFYQLVKTHHPKAVAANSVLFLLLFPTSFFFSTAYSEALFFLLLMLNFWQLQRRQFWLANLSTALLSLTRPYGIIMLLVNFIAYGQHKHWQIRKFDAQLFSLLLPLLAVGGWMAYCHLQTGDPLAFLHVQSLWHKALSWPWQSIWQDPNFIGYITPLEQALTVGCTMLVLLSFRYLPFLWALTANLFNLIPLLSGTIISNTRYLLLLFPIFVLLAFWTHKKPQLTLPLQVSLLTGQILLFIAWCQFYWVA